MVKWTLVGNDNCAAGRDFVMETEGTHVSYPTIPLDTPETKLYIDKVGGVSNTGNDVLSTPTNDDVRLVDASALERVLLNEDLHTPTMVRTYLMLLYRYDQLPHWGKFSTFWELVAVEMCHCLKNMFLFQDAKIAL